MKLKYYFKRIVNNKLKLATILIFFIFPVIDVGLTLLDIHNGGSALEPNRASFLAGAIFKVTQTLLLWYLPLYLLLIAADDCIEDFKIGYKNILITKWGKKGYFKANIIKGFTIGFAILFLTLAFNLIMTQIAFAGGSYTGFDLDDIESTANLKNPLLTNCIYILFTSLLSGVVSMGGVAVAIAFHNRFLVYPIVFLLWYIPSSVHKSILNALQPFTEYSILDILPTILVVVLLNLAAVVFAYIKEIKYEKI